MIAEYILIFSLVFAASLLILAKWTKSKNPSRRLPPSLPSLPLFGSLPFLRNLHNISAFFQEKSQQLGPIFTFRVGSRLVLTLNNIEMIEEAVLKNSRSFSSRPEMFMQKLVNPETKGIIFIDTTPEWKRNHQLSLSILKDFGFGDKNLMEERILKEVEAMIDYADKKTGKTFNPKDMAFLVTSSIMMSILFSSRRSYGLGLPELVSEVDIYVHEMDMIIDFVPLLKFMPVYRKKISGIKTSSKRISDLIETELQKSLQANEKCFVSEYIRKQGPNYDHEQLKFLIRDLIAAGTDTTANTFLWFLVVMANNPKIQKKLQREIDSTIPKERLPTIHDQTKLPYFEATILELSRWRTLVPLAVARYAKQHSTLKGFFIPSGTLVLVNLHGAHYDPLIWNDPDEFRPERFLDKEDNVIGKERIIPFSIGRRSCLGETLARAEVFLILTSFLQRFTVFPPESQERICDKPRPPVDIVSIPKAFCVRLERR